MSQKTHMTMLDKELVAVAVSVATGCRPCTTYHLAEARRAGATDAAIEKAVAGAVCVRTSATEGMRRHALGIEQADGCGCGSPQLLDELVSLGAALAVNCTANIDKHLAIAQTLGVTQGELDQVAALVEMIRPRAISHAEGRFGSIGTAMPAMSCSTAGAAAKCC